jgi:amino acid transporter
MAPSGNEHQPVRPQLGLWDAVAIIIGIVIGSTIFKSPQLIMNSVSGPWMGLWAWTLGGLLSLIGALCYAELASTYPRSGGDYVYLTRAFGSWAGFLFGWAQLAVIITSSIGAIAFVFGDYAVGLWTLPGTEPPAQQQVVTPLTQEQSAVLGQLKGPGARATPEQLQALATLTPEQFELVPPGRGVSAEQLAVLKTVTPEQLLGLKQLQLLEDLREPATKATPEQLAALSALSPEQRELLYTLRAPGTGLTPSQLAVLKTFTSDQLATVKQLKQVERAKELWTALFAGAAVVVLTVTNLLGVVLGKWTQNLLSLLKVVGLGAIVYAGFRHGTADIAAVQVAPTEAKFGMAMIFVLYAYGGWNDAAFVAADVRQRRNIARALILGTLLITVIYLAVNVAYLRALGFDGVRQSWTVAADVGKLAAGEQGLRAISLLVMISALGAISGLVFTGSRVYSTLGGDHSVFALMGRWSPRFGSPVWALLIQAAICVAMVVAVGTAPGRNAIDWCMIHLGLSSMPWKEYFGGFDTLVAGTAPVFWGFFLMSGLSLFALRQQDRGINRPFSVPLFPLLPLIFCGTCFYMLYSAIAYAKFLSLIGVLPLVIGLPLYYVSRRRKATDEAPVEEEVTART